MRFEDLADFIKCYNPQNRHERTATWDDDSASEGRWRSYGYKEIIARDKTSLDIFWLQDKSLTDLDDLPTPNTWLPRSSRTLKPAWRASARS